MRLNEELPEGVAKMDEFWSDNPVEFLEEKWKGKRVNPEKVCTIDVLNMEVEFRGKKGNKMTLAESLGKRFLVKNLIRRLS